MDNAPYVPVLHGATKERPDEQDTLIAAEAVAEALRRLGYRSDLVHLGLDFAGIDVVAERRPLCVFNLVDAINGDASLAHIAPALLEHHDLIYTGADAVAWRMLLSKAVVKDRLRAAGLPTPGWSLDGDGLGDCRRVIVKSLTEHASFGIDAMSIVPAARAGQEIALRQARFGGTFFAEAFIEGREFNISLIQGQAGPVVLPSAEIVFVDFPADRPRIVDYAAKWDTDSDVFASTPRTFDFASDDTPMLEQLRDLSVDVWRLFDLRGYARVDFRIDRDGNPWILEVNLNPCLTPDAGFVAAAGRAGFGYDSIIGQILTASAGQQRMTG